MTTLMTQHFRHKMLFMTNFVLNMTLYFCHTKPFFCSAVALKATSSREALPSKVAQVEAAGLNEDEMALIIKRFKTALKGRKEYPNKNKARGKRSCFKCGKTGHFIAQCPDNENDQGKKNMGRRRRRKATGRLKARCTLARNGTRTTRHPTPMMKDWQPRPSTNLLSSPMNATLASWKRRKR
jgi:hypothetical protein